MSSPTPLATSPLAQPPTLPPPTLDLSLLTDEDQFTTESDWLNSLLSQSSDGPPTLAALDSTLSKTLTLLDSVTHDTSSLVDRTIDEITRSVPRLTFDLQLMRENALLLQFTLNAIRTRSGGGNGPDSEVTKVMEKLRVLDLVKSRMEAARDVLREAESWSTLESEVTGLVGESAYSKAAERLEEAARSMVVFQNTAEYEGRRALMVSLQNQLEASLSASLVAAINGRDVKACKTFYAIFGQIQREAEFTAYYFGSRRSTLVDSWSSANLIDCAESASSTAAPIKFTSFLSTFYTSLHSLLSEERSYLPAIFPQPAPTLSSFVQTTLEGLTPSLPTRLGAIAERYGPGVLPELILAFRATEEFAVQVDRIIIKLAAPSPSTPSAAPPPSPGTPHPPSTPSKKTRRLSQRLSISKRLSSRSISFSSGQTPSFFDGSASSADGDGEAEAIRPWETAIFEPFLDSQVEYPQLERQYLGSEIGREEAGKDIIESILSSALSGSSSGSTSTSGLAELVGKVFIMMEEAVGRCLGLTHGYGAVGLVQAVESGLVDFMERRRRELEGATRGGVKGRRGAPREQEDEDEAVMEGLEYSTEDWTTFQFGLRLLDTCRHIHDRLGAFEGRLRSRLTVLAHTVRDAREDPRGYTIPGTTKGAVLMLRQSTLNSTELFALLEPLEKAHDGPGSSSYLSSSSTPPPPPLLPKARLSTTSFTRSTQLFLHSTILAPLLSHLADYSNLSTWTTTTDQRPGAKGAFDLNIPTFSLSPTETISRVGEGLFNLPRLFEVYADDDALGFSIETLPFVDEEELRALQAPPSPGLPSAPTHRISDSLSSPQPPSSPSLNRRAPPAPVAPLSAETVISTWLTSLTLSLLSHLTTTTLPSITRLTRHGALQLVSDLDYISNVARALDVESPEELEAWRESASIEEREKWVEREGEERSAGERKVWERVARIRGWRRVGN